MVHAAMFGSMASSIVTRRPTVGGMRGLQSGGRALIAGLSYDLVSSATAEKQRIASGPAQPSEKAGFAEGKSLDFPSAGLDFPSPGVGFSFPRSAQMENSAAAGGLASIPAPLSPTKWGTGTARRAVQGARPNWGGGLAEIEGLPSKSNGAALSRSAARV